MLVQPHVLHHVKQQRPFLLGVQKQAHSAFNLPVALHAPESTNHALTVSQFLSHVMRHQARVQVQARLWGSVCEARLGGT